METTPASTAPDRTAAVDRLRDRLGPGSRLVEDPAVAETWTHDHTPLVAAGRPCAVLLAGSTDDVAAALAWASAERVPVVPRGAGTSLAGGATALDGCLVVGTERMRTIHEVSRADRLAVVDAGVITADVDRAAAEVGLMYAPDPGSHEMCTIGGNVATNAGGLRCVKYGVTREAVLGLDVVLADGRVIHTGGRTVKDVAGYDLTGLMVGSEGTLGVVTRVTVRLRPRPPQPVTVVGTFESTRRAADAVSAISDRGVLPSLLELIDQPSLAAIDAWKQMGLSEAGAMLIGQADGADAPAVAEALAEEFAAAGADPVAVSEDADEARELLATRRLALPAMERLGRCLVEDVGVPPSRLPDLMEAIEDIAARHEVDIRTIAHAGDGNAHPVFILPAEGEVPERVWTAADEVFRTALAMDGTLTGEHGVGELKQRWLGDAIGEDVLDVQRRIKDALDPLGILNPGRAV